VRQEIGKARTRVGRFLDEVTDGLLEIEGRPRARGSEVIDAEIVEDDSKKP
jgi:hypothetical protein